jgi:hypothetical protein
VSRVGMATKNKRNEVNNNKKVIKILKLYEEIKKC